MFSEYLELDLGDVVPSIAGPEAPAGPDPALRREDRRSARTSTTTSRSTTRLRRPSSTRPSTSRSRPATRCRCRSPTMTPSTCVSAANGVRGPAEQADHGQVRRVGRVRPRPRRGGGRGDHVVHQHLQSVGDARRGAAGAQGRREGSDVKPWVKTSMAPGSQVVSDYYDKAGVWPYPGEAGLLPGRLRLHHLHRQHRSAARRDLQGDQRGRPVGDRGAVGQPQLRGPHLPRREDELPGLSAAGDRLRAGRHHGLRLRDRAARPGQRRQRRLPEGHLAVGQGDLRRHRQSSINQKMFTDSYADVFKGDERWQNLPTPEGKTFDWDPKSTYVRKPPYFDGHARRAAARSPTSPAPGCWPCWVIR